jgi:hypothetical protein
VRRFAISLLLLGCENLEDVVLAFRIGVRVVGINVGVSVGVGLDCGEQFRTGDRRNLKDVSVGELLEAVSSGSERSMWGIADRRRNNWLR